MSFNILDFLQAKIDTIGAHFSSTEESLALKAHHLDPQITESIFTLTKQRAELSLTLLKAILSGYKDPLTNARIGSVEIRIFVEKLLIYKNCYEHGEDKKLERIYELISNFNSARLSCYEEIFNLTLANYTADLKSD